ncbi:MAG: FG-GAP-like repeat-containing protein [Armatimonadota bacterium]
MDGKSYSNRAFFKLGIISAILIFFISYSISAQTNYPVKPSGPNQTSIAQMKLLPNGSKVLVSEKVVSLLGFNSEIFLSEVDRSSSIKLYVKPPYYINNTVEQNSIITLEAEVRTENGLKILNAASNIQVIPMAKGKIRPYGMNNRAILGWNTNPSDPFSDVIQGLVPYHSIVKVWGKLTAVNEYDSNYEMFCYIDDGSNVHDGSELNYIGIRVYGSANQNLGDFTTATGILDKYKYDPSPYGPDGDEKYYPVIILGYPFMLTAPSEENYSIPTLGTVSGRVRCDNANIPVTVRIYTERKSILLDNVADNWVNFSIDNVPNENTFITFSAPGYASRTITASAGDQNIDIVLSPIPTKIEMASEKSSMLTCSNDNSNIYILVRDAEGKCIPNRQIQLTSTKGVFALNNQNSIIINTDGVGYAIVNFKVGLSTSGSCYIYANSYPNGNENNRVMINFIGPEFEVSADKYHLSSPGISYITCRLTLNNQPLVNKTVTFRTSQGTFYGTQQAIQSVQTNSNGNATVILTLIQKGTALVTVDYIDECGQTNYSWLSVSHNSPPLHSIGTYESNPLAEDLDGDGKKEIVFVNEFGLMTVLKYNGTVLWTRQFQFPGSNTPSTEIMDATRDNRPCVFIPAENQLKLFAFDSSGNPLAGWPVGTDYRMKRVAAAIGDINKDGSPEVVVGDESCYVFSWNPTGDWKKTGTADSSFLWKNLTGNSYTSISGSTCALGMLDYTNTNALDVVVGTRFPYFVYAFQGDLWGNKVYNPEYVSGFPRPVEDGIRTSPALGDMDGDGKNDVIVGSLEGAVYIWLSSDNSWTKHEMSGSIESSPALYDFDGDGKLDAVFGTDAGLLHAIRWDGSAVAGWEGGIRLNNTGTYPIKSSPVLGNVDNESDIEIVVGCSDGNIYAVKPAGRNYTKYNMKVPPIAWVRSCVPQGQTNAVVETSPVLADIMDDGNVYVVGISNKGVFIFDLDLVRNPFLYPWPTFHKDNQRTGCVDPKPTPVRASIQGIVKSNGSPAIDTKVYIYNEDGSDVYEPYSSNPRSYVLTVGNSSITDEVGKGAYCISQLEPNKRYKVVFETIGKPLHTEYIDVTVGLHRLDLDY